MGTTFTFDPISSPQVAADSFQVTIDAYDPENFDGFGVLSVQPPPSYMEVVGISGNRIEFSNGDWSGYIKIFRASDSLHLNCTEYGYSDQNISNEFYVDPNVPWRLLILLSGEQADPGNIPGRGRFQSPEDIITGQPSTASLYITDRWWNIVGQGSEQVYLNSNNPFPELPPPASTVVGSLVVQYQLRTAQGDNYLYLHHGSQGPDTLISDTSSAFTTLTGEFTRLLLTVPGETPLPGDTLLEPISSLYPGVSGEPQIQTAGISFTTTVYAVDDCWNVVNSAPSDSVIVGVGFPNIEQRGILIDGSVNLDITPDRGGFILPLMARDLSDPNIEESYYVNIEILGSYSLAEENAISNFPNPFGVEQEYTAIQYYLSEDADVSIEIYDKFGNLVWSVKEIDGLGGEDPNQIFWDGVDNNDIPVDSGIYFLYLRATNRTEIVANYKRKIAVIR